MFRKTLPFIIIFTVVLLLYYPALNTYFSQDDFFHFKVSLTDGSIGQFINLFGFHPFSERGIAFYRPIFREFIFNTFYSLFGLNAYPFRILQFIILFLNSYLIFHFTYKFFQNKYLSFFVAFFYSISSAQVAPLYYLAGGIQVLGVTFFVLVCLIFWEKYLTSKKLKFKLFSFLSFSAALGSHELSVVIPFLVIGLSIITVGIKKTLFHLKYFLFLMLIMIVYLYLEVTIIGYSTMEKQYQPVLNLKTVLNSYSWYIGWALGLPEMLLDFVLPGFKLNPNLLKYWGNFYRVIFIAFFSSIFILLISLIYIIKKTHKFIPTKKVSFFIFWFFAGLFPIIFLPLHKSTQYLETGLAAFWTLIGLILFKSYDLIKKRKLLAKAYISIFIASLFFLSATSIYLQRTTFWAAERGKYAKQLITQVKNLYPTLPKGATIYFKNDPNYPFVAKEWGSSSKQAAFILNNADALRLIYKDPNLKVYYEDLEGLPKDISIQNIYTLTAKIY